MQSQASPEALYNIRHSLSHIMAEAVLQLFPQAKLAIGPPIDTGFYYDFDLPRPLQEEELAEIEKRMRAILHTGCSFERRELTKADALRFFAEQPFKCEIIEELPADSTITVYQQNQFVDLCKGPHVPDSSHIAADGFRLVSVAGAYWRGNERNKMLQRIYGTAWASKQELEQHLEAVQRAHDNNHRTLGKQLDIFSIQDEGGPGLIYWHPKGARLRMTIEDYWKSYHLQHGYELVYTPHIGKENLWHTSGHLDYYAEGMFSPMDIDGTNYYAKPMNCPFHIQIYNNKMRSYRDLPIRYAELGTVYRYERSGVLHGLLRVRGFTQDDAHIFCTAEQIEDEILQTLQFSKHIWNSFGFNELTAYIATKPEKSVGSDNEWLVAERSLISALDAIGMPYQRDEGGGAFYGPKIDLKVTDSLGREWQMTTIQFDFNLPKRFGMYYVNSAGERAEPYMVHRALLGSIERFIGLLLEHYEGRLPLWLAPEQLRLLPLNKAAEQQCATLAERLKADALRPTVDSSGERLGAMIRRAHHDKVPYLGIVGDKELENDSVALRKALEKEQQVLQYDQLTQRLKQEVAQKGHSVLPL